VNLSPRFIFTVLTLPLTSFCTTFLAKFEQPSFSWENTWLGLCHANLSNCPNAVVSHGSMCPHGQLSFRSNRNSGMRGGAFQLINLRPGHLVRALLPAWWHLHRSLFGDLIHFSLSLVFFPRTFKKKMSSNNTSTSRIDSPIFSIRTVSIEKIDRSNYSTQASEIGLWLSGLGYKSHLTTIATMDKD